MSERLSVLLPVPSMRQWSLLLAYLDLPVVAAAAREEQQEQEMKARVH